jgi:hypothetical protein
MMDVYRATFQASVSDVGQAEEQYVFIHGKDSYSKLIYPYVRRGIAYIWHAPMSPEVEWFINCLGFVAADKWGETYERVGFSYDVGTVFKCKRCDILTTTQVDGICQMCTDEELLKSINRP